MAAPQQVNLDTLIAVKVSIQGANRRLKVPLRDLGANVFESKLRSLLSIPANQEVIFERYSDSSNSYVVLDSTNTQVYKTLFRAAKAKLKLRLRATIPSETASEVKDIHPTEPESPAVTTTRESFDSFAPKLTQPLSAGEAPLPLPFLLPTTLQPLPVKKEAMIKHVITPANASWSVYCNHCDKPMANEHVHCDICDNGDYDLCQACVEKGFHCKVEEHWLIKRFVQDGKVVNSVSERIAPKPKPAIEKVISTALVDEKDVSGGTQKVEDEQSEVPSRTCNSCVKVLPESDFVTCKDCDDYDLCIPCHLGAKHGHHPGHAFGAATLSTNLGALAEFLCSPGRNARHAAVCDGCDKYIYGVRHKCLNCPDWDYCSKCIKNAKFIHPAHRFVPIYDPLPEPRSNSVRHFGIFCDGPLCKDKEQPSYIEGVRYKCAVCHDTDFCANCEAAPTNRHNRTHPLIKFKTPVRNVNVTTMGEKEDGSAMATMGDQLPRRSASTETTPVTSVNAATQVQTIADLKPREGTSPKKDQIKIQDLLAEPIQEKVKIQDLLSTPIPEPRAAEAATVDAPKVALSELAAHFVRDTITDGTKVLPGALFSQVWTLRNCGPHPWPAGCSVRYVGGDNMLNVDDSHPSSASEINEATESNIIGRQVEVNEEVSFRVLMKAPKREGTAISYWRLKAADGFPFGHRLWCHIDVNNSVDPASVVIKSSAEASYKDQFAQLEAQNRKRLAMAKQQQRLLWTERARASNGLGDPKKGIDEKLKRHAEVRALAIQHMRRATEQMNAEMERLNLREATPSPEPAQKQPTPTTIQAEAEAEPAKNDSMIFPQLEKESPVSSTHEAITAPQSTAHTERAETEVPVSPSVKSDLEFFEDAEAVEYSDSESDDGFATDEEYDILNASDQDFP